ARGLGFTQIKNNKEYIKWERVARYLEEYGVSPQVGKDDYIPESIFYLLAMKASNETAKQFQIWIAQDVIPSIRKNGKYEVIQDSYMIED
ncbi:BRO family protein, partial [Enterobacter asburiae]